MHVAAWVDTMAVEFRRRPPSDPGLGNGLAASIHTVLDIFISPFGLGFSGLTKSD
jgi:hypothetical protein